MSLRPDNTLISNREMLLELLVMPFRAIDKLLYNLAEIALGCKPCKPSRQSPKQICAPKV